MKPGDKAFYPSSTAGESLANMLVLRMLTQMIVGMLGEEHRAVMLQTLLTQIEKVQQAPLWGLNEKGFDSEALEEMFADARSTVSAIVGGNEELDQGH